MYTCNYNFMCEDIIFSRNLSSPDMNIDVYIIRIFVLFFRKACQNDYKTDYALYDCTLYVKREM